MVPRESERVDATETPNAEFFIDVKEVHGRYQANQTSVVERCGRNPACHQIFPFV